MKILITGSKGLIGCALGWALRQLQIDVMDFDTRHPLEHPSYGDILDQNHLFSKVNQVDGIVHLAAVSRVIDGEKNPQLCWKTNVEGTRNVIHSACSAEREPWLIYASSREVYGEPSALPVKESAPCHPVNIYGESKWEAEKAIEEASQKGLITSIIRFSNVYGSTHDHADRVVPAFCRAAARGSPIRVDGRNNLFDFTYIEDVVQGLLALIKVLNDSEKSLAPIHLTRGIGISLEEIAFIAQRTSNFPISIEENSARSFDVSNFYGDPTRAKEVLGWQAVVPVEEGMKRLIHQFQLYFASEKVHALL
jgi:nucleoside-diphosphate-sugar epimerase